MASDEFSMADFRQRAAVSSIKRNGTNGTATADPLREALAVRNQVLGQKIVEQTLAETDAKSLEAQTNALKYQIEQRKLQEELKGSTGQNEWQAFVMSQLETLQQQLGSANQRLAEQQSAALEQQIAMLRAELARLQNQPAPAPIDPYAQAQDTIKRSLELADIIRPPAPAGPLVPPGADPTLQAYLRRIDSEDKRWEFERQDKHEERMLEIRLADERERERLRQEAGHYQTMDRFFTQAVPKGLELLQSFVSTMIQGQPAGNIAPAAAPQTAPPTLPPGVESLRCQLCGNTLLYRPEYGGVICPCGAEYNTSPAAALETTPPAAGETEQTPPWEPDSQQQQQWGGLQ